MERVKMKRGYCNRAEWRTVNSTSLHVFKMADSQLYTTTCIQNGGQSSLHHYMYSKGSNVPRLSDTKTDFLSLSIALKSHILGQPVQCFPIYHSMIILPFYASRGYWYCCTKMHTHTPTQKDTLLIARSNIFSRMGRQRWRREVIKCSLLRRQTSVCHQHSTFYGLWVTSGSRGRMGSSKKKKKPSQ